MACFVQINKKINYYSKFHVIVEGRQQKGNEIEMKYAVNSAAPSLQFTLFKLPEFFLSFSKNNIRLWTRRLLVFLQLSSYTLLSNAEIERELRDIILVYL